MFRKPQPGDWAAEDEDLPPLPTPIIAPLTEESSQDATSSADENTSGSRFERDRTTSGGSRYDRDRGQYERDREYSGRFSDRERGSRFDRQGGRNDREYDRGTRSDRGSDRGGHFDRDGSLYSGRGRADVSRWENTAGRRGSSPSRVTPAEQGFVVSIKESFGFVSSLERDGDLFFHISEAPVEIQVHDEVEFQIKYNQRSDKEMACQLVALPKGTIQVEEISDDFYLGIVTKSLSLGPHQGGSRGYSNNRDQDRRLREEHGLIEIKTDKTEKETVTNDQDMTNEGEDERAQRKREFVRFTSESLSIKQDEARVSTNELPHVGDEVRFRIAKHRKTGLRRAIEMVIVVSAREKLEKEIELELATLSREMGVVSRMKNGGGFIKCCERPVDIYFPFHEIRESDNEAMKAQGYCEESNVDEISRSNRRGKGLLLREGDEVSFYVYEVQEDDTSRSRSRLTALRVLKLPVGTVSFEQLLRSNVEGMVVKAPKEPRNGPEIIGSIAIEPLSTEKEEERKQDAENEIDESENKQLKKKKGMKTLQKVAFHLRDTEDMSYVPYIDDKVAFDEVLDKRTGTVKAVKVHVVQLNQTNRECGVISAVKEDFGFIKCVERSSDAYFRFSDVMGASQNVSNGTEVAFDVFVDEKSDNIRATRLQILPQGTIKWDVVVAEKLEGKIVAVPNSRGGRLSNRSGHEDKKKTMQKNVHGKICFVTSKKQHYIDFIPNLKKKIDDVFLSSMDVSEQTFKPSAESEDNCKAELRVVYPSALSKFERDALYEYSDWLGLQHESKGEGSHRQLEIFGHETITHTKVQEKLAASAPELTIQYLEDDVDDVRYNPHVGDSVYFDLMLVKRTKQLLCKSIKCIKAASAATDKLDTAKSNAAKGEGFIVSVKSEGFGFIQPVQTASSSLQENVFFHIKDFTTSQTLAELKEGTEVRYTILVNNKKKTRAIAISVVPAGTLKSVVLESVKGVVMKASLLYRMKVSPKTRGTMLGNKASTAGRIRLATIYKDGDAGGRATDIDANSDEEVQEAAIKEKNNSAIESNDALSDKKEAQEKSSTQMYLYNIRDIADPAVILREGDEVEFVPQLSLKTFRATHIRLVHSHAKHGVVTHITKDLGGIIRLDKEEPLVEACFTSRAVLRGDVLSEGDRVEFAYRQYPATRLIKHVSKKKDFMHNVEGEKEAVEEAKPILGQALSILRLSSSPNRVANASQIRGSRTVNSTLKEAMRQIGANAMVASRMAKGPDGTRGFFEGWGLKEDEIEEANAMAEKIIETTATTVTTTTTFITTKSAV
ncbi:hypothetical protein CCR75_004643 [Bremia lactucae]|uniref:CSD domain-containing protein n=1 Tax=Bremia lactucae TaxID=4779 RepID=A0A976FRN6_BRELC|nr:hypothetical protein CCR75_004643 [Bremia lactucae]